jgi:hypothetical protein
MEDIKISQQLRDVFMQPFDITRTDLEKTLKEPDDVQKLEFGGLGINLYMKTDHTSKPPRTFIVTESKKEGSESTIDMIFKTYLEPLGVDKNTKPFDVLKTLAEKFGLMFRIGNTQSKFCAKQTISLPPGVSGAQIIQFIERPKSMTACFNFRVQDKALFNVVEVAFAFAIKTEEYKAWLVEQESVSKRKI